MSGLAAYTAAARDLGDLFLLSGFGTLGVVHSSEDRADFVTTGIFQPDGAGHTHAWSPHVDSRLGLQLRAALTDRLSGTVQLVAESAYNNSWEGRINRRYVPSLEWANLKYQITPDFDVRVGRFALPTFLHSDYRKVGYALTMLRARAAVRGDSDDQQRRRGNELPLSHGRGDAYRQRPLRAQHFVHKYR